MLAVKYALIALVVAALAAVAFLHEYHGHGHAHHVSAQVCMDPEGQRRAIVDMLMQHMRSH